MIDRVVDTNFLISLWREKADGQAGQWLQRNLDLALGIPWLVKAEFLSGSIYSGHDEKTVSDFLERYPTLWPEESTIRRFASLYAHLKKKNQLPGPHDLWIACVALESKAPVVTRNLKQFKVIPDLKIENFG